MCFITLLREATRNRLWCIELFYLSLFEFSWIFFINSWKILLIAVSYSWTNIFSSLWGCHLEFICFWCLSPVVVLKNHVLLQLIVDILWLTCFDMIFGWYWYCCGQSYSRFTFLQFLLVDLRCHGDSASLKKRGTHTVASAALDVLKLV